LRDEKEIRLRIDLLEGQSSAIAKMLQKAIRSQNEKASSEYSERLALNRAKKEELLWVLAEKHGQSVLDLHVAGSTVMSVRQAIEKLKSGELRMEEFSPEAQALVRKGALEMRNSSGD
jgi:hypothetical protein